MSLASRQEARDAAIRQLRGADDGGIPGIDE
jgi:hypothetical protein